MKISQTKILMPALITAKHKDQVKTNRIMAFELQCQRGIITNILSQTEQPGGTCMSKAKAERAMKLKPWNGRWNFGLGVKALVGSFMTLY